MKKLLAIISLVMLLSACGEHRGQNISEYTGDYRFYAGIAEFYDCNSKIKYYVADSGIHDELKSFYTKLNLKEKEDVYIKVDGYLREEKQMEGIDPITVFVAVKLYEYDIERGCKKGYRIGE